MNLLPPSSDVTFRHIPAEKVPSVNFVQTLAANVDNEKLSDKEFRQFVRNTLPIVEYPRES
jgi:hypothetical protein